MEKPKYKVTYKLWDNEHVNFEMALDRDLKPAQMMTALLIAKRTFMDSLGIKEADLMFDRDNPTIEEEIL